MAKRFSTLVAILMIFLILCGCTAVSEDEVILEEPIVEMDVLPTPVLLSCESGTHRFTFYDSNNFKVEYLIRIPDGATEDMPLIVSMHGQGELLKPHLITEKFGVIGEANELNENRFIIVQPCASYAWHVKKQAEAVLELIDYIEVEYKTDNNRAILTGHSLGAIGAWCYGEWYTDRWAAIVPVSNKPVLKINNLLNSNVPVWVIWSTSDVKSNRDGMMKGYEQLSSANPEREVRYSVFERVDHGKMGSEPYNTEFFDWCFERCRD